MKTTLKLVAVVVAALGMAGSAQAVQIDYFLNIDADGPGTWTLTASTDAVGGMGAVVVDLVNVATITRRAPRFLSADSDPGGFTLGQPNPTVTDGAAQAFAGQDSAAGGVVYGLGAPGGGILPAGWTHVGSTANYTETPLLVHAGTYNAGSPVAFKDVQPDNAGSAFDSIGQETPIGFANGLLFTYTVPEPGTVVLAGLAIPALAFALRRRKAA